ncbi:MAG: choice-of-anchor I family protein [Planctomycetota bacterium]|nr:choice-of-anchor I family protein [Planctomycetota bacterium]
MAVIAAVFFLPACGGSDGSDGAPGADGTPGSQTIFLNQIGRFEHTDGTPANWDESAAEIVAFDPGSNRIFVVNANDNTIDIIDASDPTMPLDAGTLDLTNGGAFTDVGGPNSVAVANGIAAVAVENDDKQMTGWVYFFTAATGAFIDRKDAGALPDMVTFAPGGNVVLSANEGEPNDDYSVDPEGSVTYIDISGGIAGATPVQIGFTAFNAQAATLRAAGVRLFGNFGRTQLAVAGFTDTDPATLTITAHGMSVGEWFTLSSSTGDPIPYRVGAVISVDQIELTDEFDGDSDVNGGGTLTVYRHDGDSSVAQDVEPEYIAVSGDGNTAYVTLQENNALAVIDLTTQAAVAILPLGTKDHSIPGNEIDGSDRDGPGESRAVGIKPQPVHGLFMPDTIVSYVVNGNTYLITANEGDGREYEAFVEEIRFKDAPVDPNVTNDVTVFDEDAQLGRLLTSNTFDTDQDGDLDQLYSFGARSFSVWDAAGNLLADSGSQFAVITAQRYGVDFNNDNDETDADSRSDAKGCEPEAAIVGQIGESFYAFIGLERMGGIMVYDVTQPENPQFVLYTNNRDVNVQGEDFGDPNGDYGPEGFAFVSAEDSPTGKPLLIVGSEVSGTTTIYEIDQVPAATALRAPVPTLDQVNTVR